MIRAGFFIEQESTLRREIRQGILSEVCTASEGSIISDAIDVRTAEIRRQQKNIQNTILTLSEKRNILFEKMSE